MNDEPITRSAEKGKPFFIPAADGGIWKIYTKPAFPDLVPVLEINGTKRHILPRLKWHEYVLGATPFLLVVIGGALGGLIGVLAMLINFQSSRSREISVDNSAQVLGDIVAAAMWFYKMAGVVGRLLQ